MSESTNAFTKYDIQFSMSKSTNAYTKYDIQISISKQAFVQNMIYNPACLSKHMYKIWYTIQHMYVLAKHNIKSKLEQG